MRQLIDPMSGFSRTVLAGLLVTLVAAFSVVFVACRSPQETETASTAADLPVLPRFQPFYYDHGGERVFGDPITWICTAAEGTIVQYFERMRLDYNPATEALEVYPLGVWALSGVREPVPAPEIDGSSERFFPETGMVVQDQFLTFYEAHDGPTVLGLPLSNQLDEGELRVQYFENGRLEWHPTAPPEFRVQVGALGLAHYARQGTSALTCENRFRIEGEEEVSAVEMDVAVRSPILYGDEQQILFVEVGAPSGAPVAAVPLSVTIAYRGGYYALPFGRTDEDGKLSGILPLPNFEPGHEVNVTIEAYTEGGELLGQRSLSFKTWW